MTPDPTQTPPEAPPRGGEMPEQAWVDVLASIDRTYSELIDHQNQLEARNAELEGLRAFLDGVLGSMTDALLVCDPGGQVIEANSAFLALAGRRRDAVLGAPFETLFAEDDRAPLRRAFEQARSGAEAPHAERSIETPTGPAPLELGIAARRDSRRRFLGAVLIGRPVGELRRAYDEMERSHAALKTAQSQLVHSEKLASLGRLVAGVAHELNNPISFVYGNAHALERYAGKLETYFEQVEAGASREELVALRRDLKLDRAMLRLRQAVSGALEGAERVRDIVESLRRLSSDGTGEIEAFDLAACAETAALWVVKGRGSHARVTVHADGPVLARGRQGHVQQVVMNLVQNAIDAMGPQSTENGAEAPVELTLAREGGRATLEVADRGPGIPEDVALKIFDPFFTTKPVGEGTGLGLSISYKIVEEHGGTLTARPREGGGAVFRMELPAAGEDDGAPAAAGQGGGA
ncbi:sensor histidine kinase [Rhodovulum sp. DZ06]|uniref:sensor histidine kinase n=1 Tax=Rhodovulum sp. DZ06 TaxID=3425126 RepID=UPI003D32AA69